MDVPVKSPAPVLWQTAYLWLSTGSVRDSLVLAGSHGHMGGTSHYCLWARGEASNRPSHVALLQKSTQHDTRTEEKGRVSARRLDDLPECAVRLAVSHFNP